MSSMKKIAIDVQTTVAEKTGFGFYVKNLVQALQKTSPQFEYVLVSPTGRVHDLNAPERFWWDQIGFPRQAQAAQADLIHQPGFSAPIFAKTKVVVTVHDIVARLFGKDIPFWSRQYFARWMPTTYRHADHIIAISEHTKKSLIDELAIPAEKITVIYEAAGPEFFPGQTSVALEKIKEKLGIRTPYFVHVGTLNPRKNLNFLVRAFAQVVQTHPDAQLVIVGKKGWYYEGLFALVAELKLEKKVIFTGYLADELKPALLCGALALVFPSLYEGFGLPPLEAMACGTPVICSDSSSIPEVVGDAGILASPTDTDAWTRAMCELIESKTTASDLTKRGLARAKMFSWEKAAKETAAIYAQVLGERI